MSSNLLINSSLLTVFHPEFSILIHGYTEMLDCSAEVQCSTVHNVELFFRLYFCGFFTSREGERGPGIPCHNFRSNSYMPHVTLLSIQSCISQGLTGAGKWKIAFIHSSWSSMLCLPIAPLYCAGPTDKISAPLHPVTPEAAFSFPFDLHHLILLKTKGLCGKVCCKLIWNSHSIYLWKIHRFAPASLNLLWSGRTLTVMRRIDRLSISKQKRDLSLCVHLMTHRRFILFLSFHSKCVCVRVTASVLGILRPNWTTPHLHSQTRRPAKLLYFPVLHAYSALSGKKIRNDNYALHHTPLCCLCILYDIVIWNINGAVISLFQIINSNHKARCKFIPVLIRNIRHTSREAIFLRWGWIKSLVNTPVAKGDICKFGLDYCCNKDPYQIKTLVKVSIWIKHKTNPKL